MQSTFKTDEELECFFVCVRTCMPNGDVYKWHSVMKNLENVITMVEIKAIKEHLNGLLTFDQKPFFL